MAKIKALKVVISSDVKGFEDSLTEQIHDMQEQGLTVTINNPHVIAPEKMFNYIAVVEGRGEADFPPAI